jgi:Ca-activated chloride channel family protein
MSRPFWRATPTLTAIAAVLVLATPHAFEQLSVGGVVSSGDTPAPHVRLVAPADGALVIGQTTLRAEVNPSPMATSAVFYVDGREMCRKSQAPFECEWDAGHSLAPHQVRLVVTLRTGGRVVETVRTAGVPFAETVDVDAVQVAVTVTDDRGQYVKGLPQSAFRVFEDGKPQTVSQFYDGDAPLEFVVAVDLSSSMTPAVPQMKRALSALLDAVPSSHRLTLLGFNDEVFTLLPRHAEASTRAAVVESLSAWGRTALYEAILESVNALGSRPGRKAVLVFTDGQDEGSRAALVDVESALHSRDQILYMIGQGQGLASDDLKALMDRLSRPTGGRTVTTTNMAALQRAFSDLFEEMSHQYVLGYQTAAAADGRWHELSVKVDGGYRVRARQGFRKLAR